MKIFFSFFSLIFINPLLADWTFSERFEIKNTHQRTIALSAKAAAVANRIVRDNAFLTLINPGDDINFYKACWRSFVTDQKVQIVTAEYTLQNIEKSSRNFVFEISFDPMETKVLGTSPIEFQQFCESASSA
ncbi:hypothetical protein N8Z64_01975 [Pseudomonadales bacterium]|nr:hypothetical protein [Pseudomonadales bacterium]MDC1298307.1 hypothetical protein [Pseudomonadales bacterium]